MAPDTEFLPLPRPHVTLFGSAAEKKGALLANVLELTSSKNKYKAVIEFPKMLCCNGYIDWDVSANGEVTIEGQISPGAIFADTLTVPERKRIQLCPTEPWGISFYFPGPVDWRTSSISYKSNRAIEITVKKRKTEAERAAATSAAHT